jgi:hypothetical protein
LADIFYSCRRKLARAKEHLVDLEREVVDFQLSNPYTRVTELDPDAADHYIHKVKLTKFLPPSISDITADIVGNLRNSLDNAGYAIAVASGLSNPKFTNFPFAGSIDHMPNALGRSKDLPPQIQSLFCGFQPYPGGDDLLWALNEICVTDKHKLLIPIGTGSTNLGMHVEALGYIKMPQTPMWDRTKNEMELVTVGPETEQFNYNFHFRIFVAFNNIRVVDGEPVLGVLYALGRKVESILMAIEAESRRIGIIK